MAQNMSMAPLQTMRMEQRLTPQLIQAMEILQLPLLALESRVREELQSNPLLEEESSAPDDATPTAGSDAAASTADAIDSPAHVEEPSDRAKAEAEGFDRLDRMSREYGFDSGDTPYSRPSTSGGDRDAKLDAMANSAARDISLEEYLGQQWALMDLAPDVRRAGLAVIEWMDPDGYLRMTSEELSGADTVDSDRDIGMPLIIRRENESMARLDDEIAHAAAPPIEAGLLEEAIARVQSLEPRGVGARDLTECLLIQLDALAEPNELAELLVENHLLDIAKNRLATIARDTGRTMDEIKDALAVIARLHYRPGLAVSSVEAPRIVPDVIVENDEDGAGFTVRLARGSSPKLRISPHYHQMLQNRTENRDARDFLRKNYEAASALIDAIRYRRERMLEIARIVVERQREFLDYGPQALKILYMRDLAAELGCDPSTISRTVDGKYIQTPQGVYPLRMFFTSGTSTADGTEISWDAVKQQVREIIDAENKSDPLSDDQIAERLASAGHANIARRTVAKYRSQMGIPQKNQRKQF